MIKFNDRFFMRIAITFFFLAIIFLAVPVYMSTFQDVNVRIFSASIVTFGLSLHFGIVAIKLRKIVEAKEGSNNNENNGIH
ncbi:hypothetical protein IM538_13020 [Cytobacillus suaedae]|nr:hypothetical protein IM538_13020 [Cytobacillus suaedae]